MTRKEYLEDFEYALYNQVLALNLDAVWSHNYDKSEIKIRLRKWSDTKKELIVIDHIFLVDELIKILSPIPFVVKHILTKLQDQLEETK